MLNFFNGRLSIGFRLSLIAVLFVATLALSAGLHVTRGLEQLSSTRVEQQGQAYIGAIWAVETTGQASGLDPFVSLNATFATEAKYKALLAAQKPSQRLKAGEKLIWDVSAASNLAQDPGADSFYVAEALTKRLPALATEVQAVSSAVGLAASDPERVSKIAAALAKIEIDVGKAETSFQTAIRNDKTGTTAQVLTGPSKELLAAVKAVVAAARASANGPGDEYVQAQSFFTQALNACWVSTYGELDRLLAARIDVGQNTLIFDLCMIAGLAIPVLILMWWMTVGLSRRFRELDTAMERLNRGDKSVDVPYQDDTNETGRIAHTLLVMKKSLIQREKDEAQREADRAAAEAARIQAETDAQARAQALVVGTFGEGLQALANANLSYRLSGDLPPAYLRLRDDFNSAIAQFEDSRKAAEVAARQREIDRLAAEKAQKQAEEDAQKRSIELVVSSFGEGLAALARRDLTYRLTQNLPTEYRILQDDFNNAIAQLEDAMEDVRGRVADISGSAHEIRKAANEMAQRTEREAAALEESAASINQVSSTVAKSAEGAHEASRQAADARTAAERGSAVALSSVEAIHAIEKSSSEISQIIAVMDEISFQTNLLALNAGVEAARAGDAGRGFAVVASEVRALAGRSSTAAKQIRDLIKSSQEQVSQGVRLVGESGSALQTVAADIGKISALMNEIAAAQRDQSVSLREIDSAVDQMDRTTQQNAAMAEQSNAASEALASYARELSEVIGRFVTSSVVQQRDAAE